MTWAEFRIRLFAYRRLEIKEYEKVRLVCYQIYVSNWFAKKKPKSIESFMPLDLKKKAILSKKQKDAMKAATEQYFKEKKALENG